MMKISPKHIGEIGGFHKTTTSHTQALTTTYQETPIISEFKVKREEMLNAINLSSELVLRIEHNALLITNQMFMFQTSAFKILQSLSLLLESQTGKN